MSATGLAIIYIIIWWIVFFAILPVDVERKKTTKIEGEDSGSSGSGDPGGHNPPDLRRQAARGRPHVGRLQHRERVDAAPGSPLAFGSRARHGGGLGDAVEIAARQ